MEKIYDRDGVLVWCVTEFQLRYSHGTGTHAFGRVVGGPGLCSENALPSCQWRDLQCGDGWVCNELSLSSVEGNSTQESVHERSV